MEYFDIVDELGNPTGEIVSREEAHRNSIRHRTSHIWVIRKVGNEYEVLLQQRSFQKDSFPGIWDTSSAGHIQAHDEPLPSAIRELNEELGIKAEEDDLVFIGVFPIKYEMCFNGNMFKDNEISNVFLYTKSVQLEEIEIQKEELEKVDWFNLNTLMQRLLKNDPMFCIRIESLMLLKNYLDQLR